MTDYSCGTNLTGSFDESTGVLIVTGTGATFEIADSIRDDVISIDFQTTTITRISGYCFGRKLQRIEIPARVSAIDSYAFGYTEDLATITVDSGNTAFCASNNILYNFAKTEVYAVAPTIEIVSFEETLQTIRNGVFSIYAVHSQIVFPSSLLYIFDYPYRISSIVDFVPVIPASVLTVNCTFRFSSGKGSGGVEFENRTDFPLAVYSGIIHYLDSIPQINYKDQTYKLIGWTKNPWKKSYTALDKTDTHKITEVTSYRYNDTSFYTTSTRAIHYAVWAECIDEVFTIKVDNSNDKYIYVRPNSNSYNTLYIYPLGWTDSLLTDPVSYNGWTVTPTFKDICQYSLKVKAPNYSKSNYPGIIDVPAPTSGGSSLKIRVCQYLYMIFNTTGGSAVSDLEYKDPVFYDAYIPSTTPTKSGFKFLGWGKSASSTEILYHPGDKLSRKYSDNPLTVYAIWERTEATIEFDANGGIGAPSSSTIDAGASFTIPSTKPTKDGFKFLGWAVSSTASSATHQPGTTITPDADMTFYAIWTPLIDVTFDANGGTGAPSTMTGSTSTTTSPRFAVTLPATKPTRTGFRFLFWSTERRGL